MEKADESTYNFYTIKAHEFSATRYRAWPRTEQFLLSSGLILDSGCGNGRSILTSHTIAFDYSKPLLQEAQKKKSQLCPAFMRGNILLLPFKENTFDKVLSVAVIHHLSTPNERLCSVKEMYRVLKEGGEALIYVWDIKVRLQSKFTHILDNDFYVSWKQDKTYLRYYHLFEQDEFLELLIYAGFKVKESGYEQESIYAVVYK